MSPSTFFKCLADDTRLKLVFLISQTEEACVCDLMTALALDQPKTSRHLAQLRQCEVLIDERRGRWVYYKLNPNLPSWATDIIKSAAKHNQEYFHAALHTMLASQASTDTTC